MSHVCEIRFHDIIGQGAEQMYFYTKVLKHGCPIWPNEYVLDPYFRFNLVDSVMWEKESDIR